MFIDVHAHLDFENLLDLHPEIKAGLERNNIRVLTNTMNPENFKEAKNMFQNWKNVLVCPGLYPQDAEKISEKNFSDYLEFLKKERDFFPAIGEVGLDHHHTKDENLLLIQEKRFRAMVELAIEINKPLIIHTRKAEKLVLDIISEYQQKTGFKKFILHCFTGKKKLINEIRRLKIFVSIPLVVLNTESFQILVRELPISQVLVETDSPFLKPGGGINTPLNVPLIYKKISEIKGLDEREIESIIYRNYQKLF